MAVGNRDTDDAGHIPGTTVLVGLAVLVAVVALVTVVPLTAAASPHAAHRTAPGRPEGAATPTTSTASSPNWSGYVDQAIGGGAFDQVGAQWVQPAVRCTATASWTLLWVGFDGWPASDQSVEQGGTSARCVGGVAHYRAFYEMWPASAVTTVFPVAAGDRMTASVVYSALTEQFLISVTDDTSGRSETESVPCPSGRSCARTSAEWVAESPSHFGTDRFFPPAPYQEVSFSAATVTDAAGHSGGITGPRWTSAAVDRIAGASGAGATVSPLHGGGHSFSDTSTSR